MKTILHLRKSPKKRLFKSWIFLITVLFAGSMWQSIMLYYEAKDLQYPGQLIEVNNHRMHIYAKGSGSPTVVFTVGSGTPCAYTDYYFIQQEISRSARTVSYDRPGYGWSEYTNIPRTIDEQVSDLHELLNKAGEKPPYILVGHSLSSLEVIHYAQMFPKEVSGIVLIDGGNPEYYANYNEELPVFLNYALEGLRDCGIVRALGSMGVLTPMVNENKRYKLLPREIGKIDRSMFYRNLGNKNNRSEIKNMKENAREVISNGSLRNIPLVILTSKSDFNWEESQRKLLDWSSSSTQEDIAGASHYIHWDNPQAVTDRIQSLIEKIRKNA